MASLALLIWVIVYCVLGSMIVIWPDKTRQKINHASNSNIRWWGVLILGAGVWLAIAVLIINSLLGLVKTMVQ
jgi:uncharacterized membrane protein